AIYPGNPTVPATSRLASEQRAALNKKAHDSMPVQSTVGLTQSQELYNYVATPTVLAPTNGLVVVARTPMAIKLAPPNGWNVSSYLVTIQAKDAKGNWFTNSNIPVGAAQAQSSAGYTGFGAGAPPAFLSLPGVWRLAAQVSSPKQSGW